MIPAASYSEVNIRLADRLSELGHYATYGHPLNARDVIGMMTYDAYII